MGVDYYLMNGLERKALYLDRAHELVCHPKVHFEVQGEPITADLVRSAIPTVETDVFNSAEYKTEWLEVVASWLDEHGPATLLPDNDLNEPLTSAHCMWFANMEGPPWFDWDIGRTSDGVLRAVVDNKAGPAKNAAGSSPDVTWIGR